MKFMLCSLSKALAGLWRLPHIIAEPAGSSAYLPMFWDGQKEIPPRTKKCKPCHLQLQYLKRNRSNFSTSCTKNITMKFCKKKKKKKNKGKQFNALGLVYQNRVFECTSGTMQSPHWCEQALRVFYPLLLVICKVQYNDLCSQSIKHYINLQVSSKLF